MSKATVMFAVIALAAGGIGFFMGGWGAAVGLGRVVFFIMALFTVVAVVLGRDATA